MTISDRKRAIPDRFGNSLLFGLIFLFVISFAIVFMSQRSLSASAESIPSTDPQRQSVRESSAAQGQTPAACISNPVVINTNDSGAGSLRDAIATACVGDTITFNIPTSDPGFSGGVYTITLLTTSLSISNSVTINGPGAGALTIRQTSKMRIFNIAVNSPGIVTFSGLTIADGFTELQPGSAIINNGDGTVNLSSCILTRNRANNGGAAVSSASGTINVTDTQFLASMGGGISSGGTLNVSRSTFDSHSTPAVSVTAGNGTITNSTFNYAGNGIQNKGPGTVLVVNTTINSIQGNIGLLNYGPGLFKVLNCIAVHDALPPPVLRTEDT